MLKKREGKQPRCRPDPPQTLVPGKAFRLYPGSGEDVNQEQFEPKILAFICNWCAYGAADLAGVSRLQYPPNVRAIRVMCSATVSPHHILRALQDGADGVLVGG
jgi:F420-non-reducing hydrogenase iron-sulfur subunit